MKRADTADRTLIPAIEREAEGLLDGLLVGESR